MLNLRANEHSEAEWTQTHNNFETQDVEIMALTYSESDEIMKKNQTINNSQNEDNSVQAYLLNHQQKEVRRELDGPICDENSFDMKDQFFPTIRYAIKQPTWYFERYFASNDLVTRDKACLNAKFEFYEAGSPTEFPYIQVTSVTDNVYYINSGYTDDENLIGEYKISYKVSFNNDESVYKYVEEPFLFIVYDACLDPWSL